MTSAALDLGGGSTQITYEPHGSKAPTPVVSLPGPHRNISLYTYRLVLIKNMYIFMSFVLKIFSHI